LTPVVLDMSEVLPAKFVDLHLTVGHDGVHGDKGVKVGGTSGSSRDDTEFEGGLSIIVVDEVHLLAVSGAINVTTGIEFKDIVIIGIRVPSVLLTTVTNVGVSTTISVLIGNCTDTKTRHSIGGFQSVALGISTENLSRETVLIILHHASLGELTSKETDVAGSGGGDTFLNHGSHSSALPSSLEGFNFVFARGRDKQAGPGHGKQVARTTITQVGVHQKVAVLVPVPLADLVPGIDVEVDVIVGFILIGSITIDFSLISEVVDTVRDGFLARFTSDLLKTRSFTGGGSRRTVHISV